MKQQVRVIRDLSEIKLVRGKVGPFTAGQMVEVKPWVALTLERRGLVEPIQKFTATELRKYILAEERTSAPGHLPQNFYVSLADRAKNLRAADKHDQLVGLQEAFSSLLDLRVQKLAQLAVSETEVKNLPPEEQFLVNRLTAILGNWRKRLDRSFGGGIEEEVGEYGGEFGESV